jgi:acetaldehyde dehydrogenase
VQVIDLTPAAIGPYVIPAINLNRETASNINIVTCGGQATIAIVAAVSRVAKVHCAEIIASIASNSAGPARAPRSTSSPSLHAPRLQRSAVPSAQS